VDAAVSSGAASAPTVSRKSDAPNTRAATSVAMKPSRAKTQPAKTGERKRPRGKSARGPMAKKATDEGCVHVARAGESVAKVAARYHVTRQAVLAENRLAGGVVKAGQRLAIPGCDAVTAPVNEARAVELDNGLLLARVGPDRVPTRLFVAVPQFGAHGIEFSWPVDGPIASGFGRRRSGWHAGIDIQAHMGAPVLAAAPGTVVFSGWAASYGRAVKIEHSNGFVTIYAHNHENIVQVGDTVETGTVVATVGKSGRASWYHLHFEIRRDGMAFNPLYLLDSRDHAPILASTRSDPASETPGFAEPLDLPVPFEVVGPIDEDPDE
jgi:murein DD-endopeptidase MepM/ murein hydrolase activator NlpD